MEKTTADQLTHPPTRSRRLIIHPLAPKVRPVRHAVAMSACEELGARMRRVTYKSEPNGEPLYCPYCEVGELDSWNCYPQCEEIYDRKPPRRTLQRSFASPGGRHSRRPSKPRLPHPGSQGASHLYTIYSPRHSPRVGIADRPPGRAQPQQATIYGAMRSSSLRRSSIHSAARFAG